MAPAVHLFPCATTVECEKPGRWSKDSFPLGIVLELTYWMWLCRVVFKLQIINASVLSIFGE